MPEGRVLHVMRVKGVSGAENHLVDLIGGLRAHGVRSDVLVLSPEPEALTAYAERLAAVAGAVRVRRMTRDLDPRLVLALRRERYDIVHAHLVHADWHVAAARPAGCALVSSKHNHDPFRERTPVAAVERAAARRFDATIAISQSLADFTRRWSGVDADVVHYGIPAGPEPEPVQRDGLLFVGRLEPQKGLDVLIDAFELLRVGRPRATLRIAGDGGQAQWLRARTANVGGVELLGRREDVPALMRSAALLVHPARWEGFGLVLLEAMREGLPVVASAVGAIPEVVADGVTGSLVAPGDPRALAEAVGALLDDPARRAAFGAAGRARLVHEFTPERMAAGVAAVYRRAAPATATTAAA